MSANQINRIIRAGPGRREFALFSEPLSAHTLGPNEARVRNHLTLIYPGYDMALGYKSETEGMWLMTGCLALGEVTEAGDECPLLKGEKIFWNGPHADYGILNMTSASFVNVDEFNPQFLLAGIAAEAESGLQRMLPNIPGHAIVLGQGMLGHLAAQWLKTRGASVVVVENSPKRLEFSKYLGLTQRIDTHNLDWRDRLARFLPEGKAGLIVEACGYSKPLLELIPFLAEQGKIMLLGNWRPEAEPKTLNAKLADALGNENYELISPPPSFAGSSEHSESAQSWIQFIETHQNLSFDRLLTHRTKANEAAMDFKRLATGVKSMCGVVVDWSV